MSSTYDLSLQEMRDAAELAATVAAAAEAGIFEGLADEPASAPTLADRLGLDRRAVAITLPLLERMGLLHTDGGAYALTPDAQRQLGDPESPEYAAGGLPLWLANLRAWTELPNVLRMGRPAITGEKEEDEDAIARFMAGMAAAPEERVRKVVDLCLERRPDTRTALDLGGGPGHFTREFARRGLEATLFDTPETVDYVANAYGLADVEGLRLARGDFLADPLPGGPFDVALMSNITHIYSPEDNRALLEKVYQAVRPGGIVAIADFVRGRSPRATRFALVMLLRTERGNTYTENEYRAWLDDTGFGDVRVDDLDPDRQLTTAVRQS